MYFRTSSDLAPEICRFNGHGLQDTEFWWVQKNHRGKPKRQNGFDGRPMVDDEPDGFCKCLTSSVEGTHTVSNHIGARSRH